ncbi:MULTISPECIES: DNA-binding protein [Vibrio]|uniref:Mu DNA-binding domain protein n=1 Tax=Vibrio spartinae TaxID=1918945 RepID=A0A1N6M640_9VIBR|nr:MULTISPECIES: DNA-binding protein [Vibrio]WNJ96573.1 DNA-binding protein [Vibrio ruber]SIO94827.1 Mu DNA-binding domain protein [Vibrio spartinae]
MKEWFLTKDLVGKPGMPETPQGVTNKARNENWLKRKPTGIKGRAFEYHISSFPQSTQAALNISSGVSEPAPTYNVEKSGLIDERILEKSIEAVELLCSKKGLRVNASKKAKIITLIYLASIDDKNLDESYCYSLLELAS